MRAGRLRVNVATVVLLAAACSAASSSSVAERPRALPAAARTGRAGGRCAQSAVRTFRAAASRSAASDRRSMPGRRPSWLSVRPAPRHAPAEAASGSPRRPAAHRPRASVDRRPQCNNDRDRPYRRAVAATCRGPLRLSVTIRSFSSSVHRRRRPVSTTSNRETSALSVRTAIRSVSHQLYTLHKAALGGGVQRRTRLLISSQAASAALAPQGMGIAFQR